MSKNFSLYAFIIFISSLILIFSSKEGKNNNQIPNNESKNNTQSSKNQDNSTKKVDLFKDFDMSNILHIDNSNFTTEMPKYDYIFILFYAPWCDQCKTFIPIYLDTAKYCKENNISVAFTKIDVTESNQAARGFKIREFPSIFFIHKGNKMLYNLLITLYQYFLHYIMKYPCGKRCICLFFAFQIWLINNYISHKFWIISIIKSYKRY